MEQRWASFLCPLANALPTVRDMRIPKRKENESPNQRLSDGAKPQLTGVAGVHYVAAYLSYNGFHAVPTTRNVKGPDLLVSNLDGSETLSVQVKSTAWAIRTRGRGPGKAPHHCEWDIGWASAKCSAPRLLYALVDLKDLQELPDIYFVPSQTLYEYFKDGDPKTWIRARYHPLIQDIAEYRNNLKPFFALLGRS
jgi:hypothetical protein